MDKVISALKWLLTILFFLAIIVGVVQYAWWFRVAPPLPGEDNTSAYITGIVLLVIYGLTTTFWKFAKNIYLKGFLLSASIFWLLANIAYIGWFKPFLDDSVNCNGSAYFVTYHQDYWFSDWDYYQVTKWHGTSYKKIYWGYPPSGLPNKMICYEKENEIKAFSDTYLRFSDRADIFDSKPVTQFDQGFETTLGSLSYRLHSYDSSENADGVRKYLLTICEPDKTETCKFIPIDHSSPTTQDETGNLIADLGTNEIYILFNEIIYFAYGDETRKFDLLASKKLSDLEHYSVAGYRKDNAYVYVLYECDLSPDHSNCECYYIPFSYTTPEQKDVKLAFGEGNGKNIKLNVFIGNELVFVYQVSFDDNKCRWGCPESQCLAVVCTTPGQ
jgi:hypothetical protein